MTNGGAHFGPAATPRQNPRQAFAQAEALAQAGRHAEAEAIYRRLNEAHPSQPILLNALALAVKARGANDEAEALLQQAVTIAPHEPGLRNNLGNLLRRREAYAAAELEYRAALAISPSDADAHYNLGLTLENLGRLDDAVQSLGTAVRLRPNYAKAMARVGAVLLLQNKPAEGLTWIDRAIAAQPDYFDALYFRGDALVALKRFDEAVATLKRAVALRPDSYEAHFALGSALDASGNADEDALSHYWRAVELKPDYERAHYGYAQLSWTLGRKDQVRRSFAYARDRVGPRPDLLLQEAQMLRSLGEHAEVERLMRAASDAAPGRADVAAALAASLTAQKKWEESEPHFARAVALDPASVEHRRNFAVMLMHAREHKRALELLQQAREIDGYDQLTLATLALAYRETGDDTAYRALMDLDRYVRTYDVLLPKGYTDAAAFNNALAEELNRMHTRKVEPFDQTLRGGTQTMGNLFSTPPLAVGQVRDSIAASVASYIRELPDDPTHPMASRKADDFSFSGSWSCRLNGSGFHTNHVHHKGWISSAYYVHVPDAVDDERERQGWLKFGESNLGLGERDAPSRHERPVVGRLVLFPSYFWHGTVPFQSSDSRLTVAFDVVPGRLPGA